MSSTCGSRRGSVASFASDDGQSRRLSFTSSVGGSRRGSDCSYAGGAHGYYSNNDKFGECLDSLARYAQLREELAHSTQGANAPVLIENIKLQIACLEHHAKDRAEDKGVKLSELEQMIELSNSLATSHNESGGVPYTDVKGLDQFLADQIRADCMPCEGEDHEFHATLLGPLRAQMGSSCPLAVKEMDKSIMRYLMEAQKTLKTDFEELKAKSSSTEKPKGKKSKH